MNFFPLTCLSNVRNRFRWAFCQLESLRHCFPPSVRHTLDELPESLDETYERVLGDIKKQNRDHAHRLLQCLAVATRPLLMEELAEVLAVDFDDVEGIPKLKPDWRWEDHEQALLTSCSSLIAIVETGDSRVVQFSHFSVKEFLTSARLATSSGVSRYYIDLEPAHTILAQASMSILLQSGDRVEEKDVEKSSPLAKYAARYWVTHAQFKEVSSCLRKAMGYLFDPDKPYFTAWLQSHDIDSRPGLDSPFFVFTMHSSFGNSPLYYAALCGFRDLVEDLVIKFPQDVNARSGCYVTPLVAALAGGHSQTARCLCDNGAHLNILGEIQATPLHSAAWFGDFEMVQILIDYKADINARGVNSCTSLHETSFGFLSPHILFPRHPDVARLLLERGADVNVLDEDNATPLHLAAGKGVVGVVHVLLEHGANVGVEDNRRRTPLHAAAEGDAVGVVHVLLEHGANVGAEDNECRTPLHAAAEGDAVGVVPVLLEHGANMGAKDKKGRTPLLAAAEGEAVKVVPVLLEHGADVGAEDNGGRTPLHAAAEGRGLEYESWENDRAEVIRVLVEHGANVRAEDKEGRTPLHAAAEGEAVMAVSVLLIHGANVGAKDNKGRTPFQIASAKGYDDIVELLSGWCQVAA